MWCNIYNDNDVLYAIIHIKRKTYFDNVCDAINWLIQCWQYVWPHPNVIGSHNKSKQIGQSNDESIFEHFGIDDVCSVCIFGFALDSEIISSFKWVDSIDIEYYSKQYSMY